MDDSKETVVLTKGTFDMPTVETTSQGGVVLCARRTPCEMEMRTKHDVDSVKVTFTMRFPA